MPRLNEILLQNDALQRGLQPINQEYIDQVYKSVLAKHVLSRETEKVRLDLINLAQEAEEKGQTLPGITDDTDALIAELRASIIEQEPTRSPLFSPNSFSDRRVAALNADDRRLIRRMLNYMELHRLHPEDAKEIREQLVDISIANRGTERNLQTEIGEPIQFCREMLQNCRRMSGRDFCLVIAKKYLFWALLITCYYFAQLFLGSLLDQSDTQISLSIWLILDGLVFCPIFFTLINLAYNQWALHNIKFFTILMTVLGIAYFIFVAIFVHSGLFDQLYVWHSGPAFSLAQYFLLLLAAFALYLLVRRAVDKIVNA